MTPLPTSAEAVMLEQGAWQPIETAPTGEVVALAYFGANQSMFGAKAVGNYFQWPTMPERLLSGWPFPVPPTHFLYLPEPPGTGK